MSFDIATLSDPGDPATSAPYPRGLTLDLVLEAGTLKEILDSYELTPEQFKKILANPAFRKEYEGHKQAMETEGWSFRKKCQAQAELYLNLVFRLANSEQTPAAVRADLIKSTVKWAGLDTPPTQGTNQADQLLPMMAEQLKDMPEGELEMRVMQVIARKGPAQPKTVQSSGSGLVLDNDAAV